jgi:hypothetical protein
MSGLRLLLRLTPIVLGAAAAAVWLRRERVERPMLPAPAEPAPAVPARADRDPAEPADIEGAAIELESQPIDIVTVVDDLLGAGR